MNFGRKLPATLGPLAFKRAGVQPMQQRTWMHVAASGRAYKSKFVKSDLLFNAKNPHWVSSCLSFFLSASTGATYIFTPFTCTTTIISLEPCALNAEFQHFALSCSIVYWRFNKMSLLCRYQHFILRFNKMSLLRRYQHFILRFNKMSLLRRYQHFILRFNKMSLLRTYQHFILRFNKCPYFADTSISYWDLIKCPYFADTIISYWDLIKCPYFADTSISYWDLIKCPYFADTSISYWDLIKCPYFADTSISYWDLIKCPYFADTTKRGDRWWKETQRQSEDRVTLRIIRMYVQLQWR
jgi:hypothetical protein